LTSPGLYEYSWKLHQADGAPLETIKLSNATGVTVKASFAQNGATDIFNNIRDQQ
jgi:hypothetical protein